MTFSSLIYFIACHGGPAAHFSDFAKELSQNGYRVELLATGPALSVLQKRGGKEFNSSHLNIDDPSVQQYLAKTIVTSLEGARTIITDVGHPLMACIQEEIAKRWPKIERIAYYDNPEPFVPGGYSETAAKVMSYAHRVLFANEKLASEKIYSAPNTLNPFPFDRRLGLGYYPIDAAITLSCARGARKDIARRLFLERHKILDTGQKILVYFGANNTTYFEQAFPAFLRFLQEAKLDPSEYLVLLQQHPGAQVKNIDGKLAQGHPLLVSKISLEEAQILADQALYYQTSMAPQLVLAGIPTMQVGHETYPDILIQNCLIPSATSSKELLEKLNFSTPREKGETQILSDLGIAKDWPLRLKAILE